MKKRLLALTLAGALLLSGCSGLKTRQPDEDALPELPDAPQPTRASSMTPAIRQAMIRFIFNLSFRSQGEVFGVQ